MTPPAPLRSATEDEAVAWFAGHRDLDRVVFPVLCLHEGAPAATSDEGTDEDDDARFFADDPPEPEEEDDGWIYPARDAMTLRRITEMSMRDPGLVGMEILDAAGQRFRVRAATPELDLGPTGVTRWWLLSFDLETLHPEPYPETKARVATRGGAITRFEDRLRATRTIDDLYDLVARLHPYEI